MGERITNIPTRRRLSVDGEAGFSLVELMIAVAIIAVLMAIAIPELQEAKVRSEMRAVTSDLRSLHTAFKQFYLDNNQYPDAGAAFNLSTFDPLAQRGYYSGRISVNMLNDSADAYDAPDDQGTNQEFWIELTLQVDNDVRFLVADSNDAPLGGGEEYDGVAVFRNGARVNM